MQMLTPHFSLLEMTQSDTGERAGIDNTPSGVTLSNLVRTCGVLELIRALLGNKTMTATSGYRCPPLNALVGGAMTYQDLKQLAQASTIGVVRAVAASRIQDGRYSTANSAHMLGLAGDIYVYGFGDALAVSRAIQPKVVEFGIDQLIFERSWTHVGLCADNMKPRHEILTLMPNGSYSYGINPK